MEAIIYTSNTGYTEQYALILGEQTGLPVYTLKSAKCSVSAGAEVIYFGWLMASGIKGYKKAARKYRVCAVCAVGMSPDDSQRKAILKRAGITDTPLFVLQGGFDINRLHGIYKLMMKAMISGVGKKLADKANRTPAEADLLDLMQNGGSRVSKDKLAPVFSWYNENR